MTPDDLEKHPIGEEPGDDDPLLRELRAVSAAIEQESAERHKENAEREKRLALQRQMDQDAEAEKDRKTRNKIVAVAAVVAVDLFLSTLGLVLWKRVDEADQRDRQARVESRKTNCGFVNDGIERDRAAVASLLSTSQQSQAESVARGDRPAPTADQQAQTDRIVRLYVERQGFRYVNGQVVAAKLDCDAYSKDPIHTTPTFPKEGPK